MGERREAVQNIIQEILERYPFLKIDIKDGITETEISFFSYDAAMDDASFLDNFKADLLRLARYLDEGGKASVTINFSGVICQVQDRQRFRMKECAQTLHKSGAASVTGLVVASGGL